MTTKPKIKHEGDRVWIDGVPVLKPKTARDLKLPTFAGALEAALSVTEHPVTYEDILGVSGLAFRVRWRVGEHGPTGCPCSPVGETPAVWAAIGRATGWQLQEFVADGAEGGWGHPRMQHLIPEIIQSIDAGRPLLAVDRNLDSGVLYGYTDQGAFLGRTYYATWVHCSVSELGQTPALAIFLKEHVDPPPLPEVFEEILEAAVDGWHRERVGTEPPPFRDLKSGQAALEAWISFLTHFEELSIKEEPETLLGHHIWNYQHLYEARKAAAAFLRRNAGLMPSAQQELLRASAKYQEEADLLATVVNFDAEVYLEQYGGHCQAFFRGAWDDSMDAWTDNVRAQMRQIMEGALEIERSAMGLMESAL